MATLINNAGVQHYANKMVLAENRKVGSKSLPTALNDIDLALDEMKILFDTEYGSVLDMKLENNENVFSVGSGTDVNKRSEVENSFTDVELSGNSLVAIFNLSYTTTNEVTTSYYHIGTYEPNLQLKDDVYYTLLPMNPLEYVYSIALYNKIDGEFGVGGIKTSNKPLLFKKNTSITTDILFRIYLHGNNTTIPAKTTFNFLVLEGDWTNKPIPQYFEGLKSVGEVEGNEIEVLSVGKNLINPNDYVPQSKVVTKIDGDVIVSSSENLNTWKALHQIKIKLKKNTRYTLSRTILENSKHGVASNWGVGWIGIYRDGNNDDKIAEFGNKNNQDTPASLTFNSGEHNFVDIRLSTTNFSGSFLFKCKLQLEEATTPTEYEPHKQDKKQISLNEPLRGLPNGVKDSIEKINGEWKIVRRCGEIILNGSEDWSKVNYNHNDLCTRIDLTIPTNSDRSDLVCNNIPVGADDNIEKENFYIAGHNHKNRFVIILPNSKLSSATIEGAKEWLSKNNATVIYLLPTPIIEDISPVTLQAWKNGTISIDEVLPVESTHTVALNKPAQIKRNIEELTVLRKRVQALEDFYDQVALEQSHQLSLINNSIELDYDI